MVFRYLFSLDYRHRKINYICERIAEKSETYWKLAVNQLREYGTILNQDSQGERRLRDRHLERIMKKFENHSEFLRSRTFPRISSTTDWTRKDGPWELWRLKGIYDDLQELIRLFKAQTTALRANSEHSHLGEKFQKELQWWEAVNEPQRLSKYIDVAMKVITAEMTGGSADKVFDWVDREVEVILKAVQQGGRKGKRRDSIALSAKRSDSGYGSDAGRSRNCRLSNNSRDSYLQQWAKSQSDGRASGSDPVEHLLKKQQEQRHRRKTQYKSRSDDRFRHRKSHGHSPNGSNHSQNPTHKIRPSGEQHSNAMKTEEAYARGLAEKIQKEFSLPNSITDLTSIVLEAMKASNEGKPPASVAGAAEERPLHGLAAEYYEGYPLNNEREEPVSRAASAGARTVEELLETARSAVEEVSRDYKSSQEVPTAIKSQMEKIATYCDMIKSLEGLRKSQS